MSLSPNLPQALLCPSSPTLFPNISPPHLPPDQDSDSDSDLSLDEERSLSIPSSESEENVRLRGRFQRQFKRAAHSERLLTNPANTTPKGKAQGLWEGAASGLVASFTPHRNVFSLSFSLPLGPFCRVLHQTWMATT